MTRFSAAIFMILTFISAAAGRTIYRSRSSSSSGGGGSTSGYVIGILLGLAIIIVLIVYCIKRHNAKKRRIQQQPVERGVVVITAVRTRTIIHRGAVPQPPPYTSSPPVYSVPLPPNNGMPAGQSSPYPSVHLTTHGPQEEFTSTDRPFSPPPAYQPTPQTPHPPPQPVLAPIQGNTPAQAGQTSSVGTPQRQGGNTSVPTPSPAPGAPNTSNV